MKARKTKEEGDVTQKPDDFKCKSEGVGSSNDFYIFERHKNCC